MSLYSVLPKIPFSNNQNWELPLPCSICCQCRVGVAGRQATSYLRRPHGQEVEADVPHALQVLLGLARHTKLSYLVGIGMRNALAPECLNLCRVWLGSLPGKKGMGRSVGEGSLSLCLWVLFGLPVREPPIY